MYSRVVFLILAGLQNSQRASIYTAHRPSFVEIFLRAYKNYKNFRNLHFTSGSEYKIWDANLQPCSADPATKLQAGQIFIPEHDRDSGVCPLEVHVALLAKDQTFTSTCRCTI